MGLSDWSNGQSDVTSETRPFAETSIPDISSTELGPELPEVESICEIEEVVDSNIEVVVRSQHKTGHISETFPAQIVSIHRCESRRVW